MTDQAIRVLTAADVRSLLPMRECIEVMASAFRALAEGAATVPNRSSLSVGSSGESMLLMPAAIRGVGANEEASDDAWFGAKVLSIVPDNALRNGDTHQGVIVLFRGSDGSIAAVVDAGAVTAIRTAAVSAVATRQLARPDATRLAILGSGVQARSHLDAMAAVRTLREVRIWSRTADRCAALVRAAQSELGLDARRASGARDAVEGADIVCTTTSAVTPVVESHWISAGTHVNAIGAHQPTERELDSETVRRARVFVDHLPAAMVEAGDILIPIAEKCIEPAHVLGDLAQLLESRVEGRITENDVTVFKSVGIAIEDIAAAAHVYGRAVATAAGSGVALT